METIKCDECGEICLKATNETWYTVSNGITEQGDYWPKHFCSIACLAAWADKEAKK